MKIRFETIDKYLSFLTMGRAASRPCALSDISNFDADIRAMHKRAHNEGDLDLLKVSIDALIADPHGRIEQFAGQQYPFNEHELLTIFKYAYWTIWPDSELSMPGEEASLEFVKTGTDPLFSED